MAAVLACEPIRQQVLRHPRYESTSETLASFESWITANLPSVTGWFNQLRAIEPDEFPSAYRLLKATIRDLSALERG